MPVIFVCLRKFISSSRLKINFTGYRILGCFFKFSFQYLYVSFYCRCFAWISDFPLLWQVPGVGLTRENLNITCNITLVKWQIPATAKSHSWSHGRHHLFLLESFQNTALVYFPAVQGTTANSNSSYKAKQSAIPTILCFNCEALQYKASLPNIFQLNFIHYWIRKQS